MVYNSIIKITKGVDIIKDKKLYFFIISLCSIMLLFDMSISDTFPIYRVKGYIIIILGMTVLLEAFVIKNKIIIYIGYIMSFSGYIICSINMYKIIDFSTNNVSSEMVMLAYVISLLSLIVSLFYKMNMRKYDEKYDTYLSGLPDDNYIFGNAILGFKNMKYSEILLTKIDDNTNEIQFICLANNLLERYDLSSIKEINFFRKLNSGGKQSSTIASDVAVNHYVISAYSGDNLGVIVADNKLDNAKISENYKINNNYEVNMIIQTDDGKKNVRIEAKTNPTKFINKVKNKLLQ